MYVHGYLLRSLHEILTGCGFTGDLKMIGAHDPSLLEKFFFFGIGTKTLIKNRIAWTCTLSTMQENELP